MIQKRYNTFALRVPTDATSLDNRAVPADRVPLFRVLWRQRGRWIPLGVLMVDAGYTSIPEITDSIERLRRWLPPDVSIERRTRIEPPDDTPYVDYRLITWPTP